jgi:thymidylate synthase
MNNEIGATSVWLKQLDKLIYAPEIIIRGKKVREHISDSVTIDMKDPYVRDVTRKISEAFRYAEAYWILTGDNRVSSIAPWAPSIEYFSDNGHVFQGAYGPKVTEQLSYVVDMLLRDRNTRQAVLSIWRENPRDSKDIPCTLSLQFLIREGQLHCVATMRSSDVWLGLPYDMFNFSCIANWVMLEVNSSWENIDRIKLGQLTINMGSSHLYEKNYVKAGEIQKYSDDDYFNHSLWKLPWDMNGAGFVEWLAYQRNHCGT